MLLKMFNNGNEISHIAEDSISTEKRENLHDAQLA